MIAPSTNPLTTAKLLQGFAIMLLAGACLFLADGGWRHHQEYVESVEWPAVQARVLSCYVSKTYSMHRHNAYYRTICRFEYEVGGQFLNSTTHTGSTWSQSMVNRMAVWTMHHPRGSAQTIHFNPEQPKQISLAGADKEIQTQTSETQLRASAVLGVAGLITLLIALILRRLNSTANPSVKPVTGYQVIQ